jgi:flavodoxin
MRRGRHYSGESDMAETKFTRPTYAAQAIPSDIKNVTFLGNPVMDNLVSSMIAMGTEVWTLRRRMKVMEAVLEKKGVTTEMLESYVPSAEQEAAWGKDRDRFIDLTMGPLAHEGTLKVSANFPTRK